MKSKFFNLCTIETLLQKVSNGLLLIYNRIKRIKKCPGSYRTRFVRDSTTLHALRTHVQKENITVLSLTPDVMRASSRISIFIVRKRKSDVVRNFLWFVIQLAHDFFFFSRRHVPDNEASNYRNILRNDNAPNSSKLALGMITTKERERKKEFNI